MWIFWFLGLVSIDGIVIRSDLAHLAGDLVCKSAEDFVVVVPPEEGILLRRILAAAGDHSHMMVGLVSLRHLVGSHNLCRI